MLKQMKPPSSFSSSSCSSSSSYRYSLPYNNTKNGKKSGCYITGFICRILCISSSNTSPSRSFKEDEKDPLIAAGASATPGVVARLMGLESLPLIDSSERSSSSTTNSVDLFGKSRSSPSVRRRKIISPYQELELEDDKFFILSFDDHKGESTKLSTRSRSKSKSSAKTKQVMEDKCKKKSRRKEKDFQEWDKENQGLNKVLEKSLDSDRNIVVSSVKSTGAVLRALKSSSQNSSLGKEIMKKKLRQENTALVKLEKEGGSENSSPSSVLEFPPDPGTATSGDISRLARSKSRRTLSEELENFSKPQEQRLTNDGSGEDEKQKRTRRRNPNYAGKWDEIRELAARDLMKWSWLVKENSKNNDQFEEIGGDVAEGIVDQLLRELLIDF